MSGSPRVCLSMIVRDEAAVIERCLDAARPVVDAVSVCDTGSTDGTIGAIERWMAREGIPGRVDRHEFRDFAHNRTLAIGSARETVESLGWDATDTHLLFLDADMVLRVDPDFRKTDLRADVHRVVQRNGSLEYPNVRLVRANLESRYVGATHEHLCAPPGTTDALLETLSIDDLNDGGSRADKYARDRRLLEEELRRDPGNARAMFYLAQTLRALGDDPRALVWYRRRIDAGGWLEEIWCAHLAIGQILAEAGDTREAARAFAAAIRRDPVRPEGYFHLAYTLRALGKYRSAFRCARAGLAQGYPRERTLFIDRDVIDWGLLREMSINGFYGPSPEEGREANERLALGRGAPRPYASLATDNAIFWAEPLPAEGHHRIAPALPAGYVPCNPSILRTPDGYRINCRAVSYRLDGYQRYSATEPDGILRTKNVLVETDRDLRYRDQREIVCDDPPLRDVIVRGLEDARLFERDGVTGFTCTTLEHHPAGYARMALVLPADGERAHPVPLRGYGDDRVQKNWLPFVESGEILALYGFEPLVVLRIDPQSGAVSPAFEKAQGREFSRFRGSAGPIRLPATAGGGRLVIVHDVGIRGLRYYVHRFLRLDEEWNVVEASAPFFFLRRGIEFACGAALAHGDEDLLITFGVEDREAWLCRIGLATVTKLLRALPDWPPERRSDR